LFLFKLLTLFSSNLLSFLDLVDYDSGATSLGLNAKNLTLFFLLKGLETLNLHHEVKLFLLLKPLLLETLVLV